MCAMVYAAKTLLQMCNDVQPSACFYLEFGECLSTNISLNSVMNHTKQFPASPIASRSLPYQSTATQNSLDICLHHVHNTLPTHFKIKCVTVHVLEYTYAAHRTLHFMFVSFILFKCT